MPQDSILFEGSIADNIALNDPNIDTDQIVNAAKKACAHDFIMDLPQGTPLAFQRKVQTFRADNVKELQSRGCY